MKILTFIKNLQSYYRSDGQCNNKVNPHFGAIYTPMARLVEDGFEDGYETISSTRVLQTSRTDSNDANDVRGLNENVLPETESDMATMVNIFIGVNELVNILITEL